MKNNNEEQEEKKVSKLSLFWTYYKEVPGVKALVKLILYFIFFAVIISVVACNQDTYKQQEQEKKEKYEEKQSITYKEILDKLLTNNLNITYNIKINEIEYRIDATYQNQELTGILKTIDKTTEFKIKDNLVYEVGLNEEIENAAILSDINIAYLLPDTLLSLLESNKSTKMINNDEVIYSYEIDNIKYQVTVKDEWVNLIMITSDTGSYNIEYKEYGVN